MKKKALILLATPNPAWNPPPKLIEAFKSSVPEVEFLELKSLKNLREAEIIFSWLIDKKSLAEAKKLKWFHTAGVQYGHLLPLALYEQAIVTNSKGVWGEYIAGEFFKALKGGDGAPPLRCRGKIAGIIGYGGIGKAVGRLAKKNGMKVLATKKDAKKTREILKKADYIFVTVPLTKETEGMINADAFKQMKDGVVILSSARPAVIEKSALLTAIQKGKVAMVVLDDMCAKEFAGECRIQTFPHATPEHYDVWPQIFAVFEKNLKRFIKGKPLLNRMDPCKKLY